MAKCEFYLNKYLYNGREVSVGFPKVELPKEKQLEVLNKLILEEYGSFDKTKLEYVGLEIIKDFELKE